MVHSILCLHTLESKKQEEPDCLITLMFRPCCRLPTDLLDNNETLLRYYQTCVRVVFMSSDHTSYLLSSSMAIWRYPRKRMLDRIFVFGHYKTPITLILRIVTTSAIFFHRTCPSSTSITDKTLRQ